MNATPSVLVAGEPASVRDEWAAAVGGSACDPAGLADRLAADPALRVLVFYRSPWEAFLDGGTSTGGDAGAAGRARLQAWQDAAQAALAAASRWPDRVRLVNAARLAARGQALADALAGDGWCAPSTAPAAVADPAVEPILLARLFEEHAPAECDAYEALESMALLLGRPAEFRGADTRDHDLLGEALRVWGEAAAARREADAATATIAALAAERDALAARAAEGEGRGAVAESALADRDAQIAHHARENELLLEHIVQLRQELAAQAQSIAVLRETTARLARAADEARTLIPG